MRITRRIMFHAGHCLKDDDSKCYHPHGHEYVVECTIEGPVQDEGVENGMVINFGSLKELMMEKIHDFFDHKFIIDVHDPRCDPFSEADPDGFVVVHWTPTAENLGLWCRRVIELELETGISVYNIRIQETSNCWVDA